MRVLIALGGNAILRRGQALSVGNQQTNIRRAAEQLARVATTHELVLTHGNGPQVGLLALQAAAYRAVQAYPLDVLGAESQGMVGYLLEEALANFLPASRTVTTLLTRVQVALDDAAFTHPTKPIGPLYTKSEAERLAKENHWHIAPDGDHFRRVVPSPRPLRVLNLEAIACLMGCGVLVIAAGGGGIPVARNRDCLDLVGVEAVIDKDLCSGLLAQNLDVDCLVIATDVANVFLDWGKPTQRAIGHITPNELAQHAFAAGSMGPKVQTACEFAASTGHRAVIGSLDDIEAMLAGTAGTQVAP